MTIPLGEFTLAAISPEEPVVQERVERFFQVIGMEKPWQSPYLKWFGLFKDGIAHLIISVIARPDNSLEVTNFYPSPTRDGVKAGYLGMRFLRELVTSGAIPYWIGAINELNDKGRKRAEKFFGVAPRCYVYVYDKAEYMVRDHS